MGAESLPGRGKLLQQHKAELRALKADSKKALSKAKSKEERTATENKYAELEKQLLQRQQQQLETLAAAAAAAGEPFDNTPQTEAESQGANEQQKAEKAAAADAAAREKGVLESLEELSLYPKDDGNRKPSKTQRRRDKKQQQLREQQRLFDEARAASGQLAEEEMLHLATALLAEGFSIFPIPPDGNCLFRSILHQALQEGGGLSGADVKGLRALISDYVRSNKDIFAAFLDQHLQTDEAYEAFCDNIRDSQDWGGEIEILAASKLLKRPITVFSYNGSVTTITYGEEYTEAAPLLLAYHKHLFASGPHYNSVAAAAENAESPN